MRGIQLHDMYAYYRKGIAFAAERDGRENEPTNLIRYDILKKTEKVIDENVTIHNVAKDSIYYLIDDSEKSGVYSMRKLNYETGEKTLIYETSNEMNWFTVAGKKVLIFEEDQGLIMLDTDGSGNY